MKKTNVHSQKGIAQLVILGIMGVLAVILPVATKLVQQNQENRSQAATATTCSKSTLGAKKCNSTAKTISVCKSVKNMDDEYEYIFTSPTSCTYGCTQSTSTTATCNSAPAPTVIPTAAPTKKPTSAPTPECTTANYPDRCTNGILYGCTNGKKNQVNCPSGACLNSTTCADCTTTSYPDKCTNGILYGCTNGKKNQVNCPSGACLNSTTCSSGSNVKANGVCGTSHNKTASTKPTTSLCATSYGGSEVVESLSDKSKSYVWSCWGSNGGTTVSCWTLAPVAPTPKTCSYGGVTYAIGKAICQGRQPAECLSTGAWKLFSSCLHGCSGSGVCNSGGCTTVVSGTDEYGQPFNNTLYHDAKCNTTSEYCSRVTGECVAKKTVGEKCDNNQMCKSDRCILNVCKDPECKIGDYKCQDSANLYKCIYTGNGAYGFSGGNDFFPYKRCADEGKVCETRNGVVGCYDGNAPVSNNGVCGTSHNKTTSTKPTTGLCSTNYGGSVVAESLSDKSKSYVWSCWGTNGGASVPCWSLAPADTTCPTTSLVGKVMNKGEKACGTNTTNKTYLYTCNGGNDVPVTHCDGTCSNGACVAAANKINGLCNENITAAPTSSACISGTFKDQPDYSGHWVWDCEGANGGTTAHCNVTTVASGCNAANVGAKKCNTTTKTITTCKSVKNMEGEFEYLYTSPITCSNGCTQSTTKDAICNSTTSCSYNGNSYPIGQKICQGDIPATCLSTGSWNNSTACKYGCSGNGVCKSAPSGNTGGGDTGGGDTGGGDTGGGEAPATLTGIKLSPNPLYLVVGKSWKVGVETIPGGLTPEYMWKSDDAKIASVDMLGNVTGVTLGETYITATAKGTDISDKIKVVVDPDGSVTPEACTGYVYDEWSDCKNGTQTRKMLSKTPDGCTGNPSYAPVTTQECSDVAISYKISFAGILPGAKCIDEYLIPETRIETDVANVPSIASGKYTDKIQTSFEETDETDSKGNRIFQVTNLVLDKDKFGSVNNFNYVKIKGPWHLKRRMCQDGQGKKMPESTVCDINLKANSGKVYDFSEYTLLAGDITADGSKRGDGVINSLDLGYIKTRLNPGSEINCGRGGDLNMDGVVNSIDLNLVKTSLTERDDE